MPKTGRTAPCSRGELGRLLSMKDASHYGVIVVSARNAGDARKWAALLIERAVEESER
jgi:hypothetical protein